MSDVLDRDAVTSRDSRYNLPQSSTTVVGQSTADSLFWTTPAALYKRARKLEFDRLAELWNAETLNSSSLHDIDNHSAYQAIIAMGQSVLPYIFAEMEREPNYWFTALRALTGADPVANDPSIVGDLDAMAEAWVMWGRDNGYA